VSHRACCLGVLEKEKYSYVPRIEPRIIQLLSVTISFCGYFSAALANAFGEKSYRSRAVLVCGCGVGWLVGSYSEINSWTSVFVASTWL